MKLNLILHLALLNFILSCTPEQNLSQATPPPAEEPVSSIPGMPISRDRYKGIITVNTGPRGGDYLSTNGKIIPYRLFRIQFYNDTVVPVELTMQFPAEPLSLLSDTNKKVKVFIIPESISPRKITETYDFGIKGLDNFLDTGLTSLTTLTTVIQPKQEYIVYIGATISELARAKLFFNGKDPQVSYLPLISLNLNNNDKTKLHLVLGIGIDPPNYYTLIDGGHITFLKN